MSKITRPILTGVFQRKRLFSLIDRLQKQPVIWVSGPPGCGKTTLVSSYLEARKIPCLWYQVDEGDADPATFLETSSYCTPFHERLSKRVAWIPNTLIYKPFRFPQRTWTAESSPCFTRCNTVWRETPRTLVASNIGTWSSGGS